MAEVTTKPAVEVPAAPVEEKHPDGSPIVKGSASTQFWPTAEKAEAIAKARTKGARRAYTITDKDGKTRFATATHHHFLMEYLCDNEFKLVITEIGKVSAAKAPATATAVLAAIETMPEAEREAVKKQIAELLKLKK